MKARAAPNDNIGAALHFLAPPMENQRSPRPVLLHSYENSSNMGRAGTLSARHPARLESMETLESPTA